MSNQSPCTDPLYPCTALTLAEKSAALDGLTRLLHRLPLLLDEAEAVKAAICALRKAATADDCRVRKIPVYGMGQAKDAVYSQRGDDYLLEAQRVAGENPPNASVRSPCASGLNAIIPFSSFFAVSFNPFFSIVLSKIEYLF